MGKVGRIRELVQAEISGARPQVRVSLHAQVHGLGPVQAGCFEVFALSAGARISGTFMATEVYRMIVIYTR